MYNFGMKRKPFGLFGAAENYGLPQGPIGTGGVFGGQFDNSPAEQKEQEKPKLFGPGGAGRNIAGFIGDYLLQQSGMQPIYAPSMIQRRQQEAALEAEKRAMANQRELLTFKAGLPQQQKPTEFERTLALANIDPNSPEGRELARGRAASMAADPNDEFVTVDLGGGRTYQGPRSGLREVLMGGAPAQQNNTPSPEEIRAEMKRRGLL